jgi:hypothetical protein
LFGPKYWEHHGQYGAACPGPGWITTAVANVNMTKVNLAIAISSSQSRQKMRAAISAILAF